MCSDFMQIKTFEDLIADLTIEQRTVSSSLLTRLSPQIHKGTNIAKFRNMHQRSVSLSLWRLIRLKITATVSLIVEAENNF